MKRFWVLIGVLLSISYTAGAQEQCEAFLAETLASLDELCLDQGTGVCYGNGPLVLEPTADAEDVVFSRPGHEAPLEAIDTLVLSPFDGSVRGWGLLRFVVPLNASDERVTLLMMGDMALQNLGDPANTVPSVVAQVATNQGLNIRAEADVSAALITPAFTGDLLRLTGIDGDWVRVQLSDGEIGWAAASGFVASDLETLETVSAADGQPYSPMQAFNFASAQWTWDAEGCPVAPPNGILLQTPEDTTEFAAFLVNGTPLRFPVGVTAYLHTDEDGNLRVDALEGEVMLNVDDEQVIIPAGKTVLVREGRVPQPADYDPNQAGLLPLESLPRPTFAAVNFDLLVTTVDTEGGNPLADLGADGPCTVGAVLEAANLREFPASDARVRHVLQVGQRVPVIARGEGRDGALWWQVTADVWVSSSAVSASGLCGTLPVIDVR